MIGDIPLFEVFGSRRSVRVFERRKIEPQVMERLLEAVQSSPSAGNLQAYQVYVVETPERIESLAKAALGQECVSGAPAVLVFCADGPRSAVKYGDRGTTLYCLQDATIAAAFAHLAASGLGLGSVMIGAFNEKEVARIIGAPGTQRPILLLPLGYPDEIPEATGRRSIGEFVVRR